ncbi:MAG: hypothetical protein WCP70_04240, partial [Methanothrix sp.]
MIPTKPTGLSYRPTDLAISGNSWKILEVWKWAAIRIEIRRPLMDRFCIIIVSLYLATLPERRRPLMVFRSIEDKKRYRPCNPAREEKAIDGLPIDR